ncbi:MAG: SufE family protein [Verrucomicrobiales bacterium]|nr:SufE family protein [Verrucomicrobiales bacterium]
MTLEEKQCALIAELVQIRNGQENFARLVARARQKPPLDASLKRDDFLVEGCMSKLWFVPTYRDGKCFFQAESDSAVVKGIASLICEFYSGSTPAEILAYNRAFLAAVGISRHLTANRRSGLGRLTERIRAFAAAHLEPAPSNT